jgi:hypothetical protein
VAGSVPVWPQRRIQLNLRTGLVAHPIPHERVRKNGQPIETGAGRRRLRQFTVARVLFLTCVGTSTWAFLAFHMDERASHLVRTSLDAHSLQAIDNMACGSS